ncbi:xanthine permease [Cohnella endophytica]|uniref:Xanthine permease n=1 Tax=Cohnella endophytica TaxID=2419778 RepID=A0A494XRK7_9BACL|nr:purine/pyrimidine permease [Cohnella endophytica]RKP50153.1 xanthine permease [Cohnella endophytica]
MRNYRIGVHLSVLQWIVFMTASSVALPIVIGGIFHFSQDEVASLMQRTFFVVGISSMLQAVLGHRFPIVDGPAGSWVSVFIMMAGMAANQGQSPKEALQLLEGGLLLAGALLFALGIFGLFYKLLNLFTPLVTNTFLFLLSLQLSGVFLKGMFGLKEDQGSVDYGTILISLTVFGAVVFLNIKGKGWTRSYAVLLGIVGGWALQALAYGGVADTGSNPDAWIKLPDIGAWGIPELNPGMALTATLFTLILVSNLVAAISATQQAVPRKEPAGKDVYNRSSMIGGISHGLSALFSAIGIVPLPTTASFIRMTGQTRRMPFILACLALSAIAIVPSIVHFLAQLPTSVASAVSLATFVQMTGHSFQSLSRVVQTQRQLTILGIGMIIGIGFTLLAASPLPGLPVAMQYALGNGLLVATLLTMILERFWKNDPKAM